MFEGKELQGSFPEGSYYVDVKPDLTVEGSGSASKSFALGDYVSLNGSLNVSVKCDPLKALQDLVKDSKSIALKGMIDSLIRILR